MFQNAFDHGKAKKDGVILPNKGECMFYQTRVGVCPRFLQGKFLKNFVNVI